MQASSSYRYKSKEDIEVEEGNRMRMNMAYVFDAERRRFREANVSNIRVALKAPPLRL